MSIQALSWVLEHSTTRHGERLVLISLANHADKGGYAYPSIGTVAQEAGIERDTAKRLLQRLIGRGYVERVIQGAFDERIRADRRPNLYRIVGGDDFSPPWLNGGDISTERGGEMIGNGGDHSSPQTVIEPSKNRGGASHRGKTTQRRFLPGSGWVDDFQADEETA